MIRGLIWVLGEIVMKRKHEKCLPQERVWSPTKEGYSATIRKLYYCVKCGLINITEGKKAKSIGYFQNCLAQLSKILEKGGKPKITQSQIRLIMKELEKNNISDDFVYSYEDQKEIFINAVQKYIYVRKDLIKKVL